MDVTFFVTPGRAGYNEVNLYFFDTGGVWTTVESTEVRFTFLDFDVGSSTEQTTPLHPGHVLVQGAHLRHAGRWRIDAGFRGPQGEVGSVSFQVLVP